MAFKWTTKPLGDVVELKRGYDLPKNKRKAGPVPIVSSSGVSGSHFKAMVDPPGVVTGRYGTIGQVFFLEEAFWPLNTTLYVRDFKGNDPLFVSYLLRTIDYATCSDKAAVPGVNRNHLHALRVTTPDDVGEQRAIAGVLGSLDDKIELNRRMNGTLESMARALFKSWFVDFDPVHANAAGQPNLPPDLAALFPAEFEPSSIGDVPKGWEAYRASDVLEVNPRRSLKKGSVAPYVDMKNMPIDGHAVGDVIDREFKSGSKYINGDTLLARITPCLENGKTAFVDFLPNDETVGWGSTEYIVLRPKPPLPVEYAYYLGRSESFRSHAIQSMSGSSGRQRVPANCFDHFWVAVPGEELANRFGKTVCVWMERVRQNECESRTLSALRDALLPKLLSGELSVADAEEVAA